jgi:hypothetical protein
MAESKKIVAMRMLQQLHARRIRLEKRIILLRRLLRKLRLNKKEGTRVCPRVRVKND